MEMESSIQQEHDDEDLPKEAEVEQLVCASSPNICGVSGSPNLHPRIGDDYQVKIPPLMSDSEHVQLLNYSLESEGAPDPSICFLEGLPISVMLIHDRTDLRGEKELKLLSHSGNAAGTKKSSKSGKSKKLSATEKTCSKVKDEPVKDELGQCERKDDAMEKVDPTKVKDEPLDDTCEKIKHKAESQCRTKTCSYFAPGSLGSCWSGDQVESFILGLYIFGKSFVPIRKFVDNKEMGDVLSFYYGRFYGSDRYSRWSSSRKVKRKKFISGEKLFSGWRQQEFISRLQPHIPENYQKTFQEMSEAIAEGKLGFEDYVSNLKDAVGIQVLVEAIGLGKGKEDLTNPAMESSKAYFPATTKACSSLTIDEIVSLLTGGFRLSKARCNDIFWEAVWPRLLARGWHSEQPNNLTYVEGKTYLVFLVPGVKKYSRRDLVKGIQYFDSVNDVLSKVASEPELMELEEAGGKANELNDSFTPQSRLYLKPRVSNSGSRSVKFTVVDSSRGREVVKAKRMRYSPRDLIVTSMVTKIGGGKGSLSIEDSEEDEEKDSKNVVKVVNETVKAKCGKSDDKVVQSSKNASTKDLKFTIVDTSVARGGKSSKIFELRHLPTGHKVTCRWIDSSMEDRKRDKDHKVDDSNGGSEPAKPSSKTLKIGKNQSEESNGNQPRKMQQFSRRPKSGHSNNLVPLVKRRRLTACISTEMNQVMANFPGKLGSKEKKIFPGLDSSSKVVRKSPEVGPQTKAACVRDMKHGNESLLIKLPGLLGSKGKKIRSGLDSSKSVERANDSTMETARVRQEPECKSVERVNLKANDSTIEAGCARQEPESKSVERAILKANDFTIEAGCARQEPESKSVEKAILKASDSTIEAGHARQEHKSLPDWNLPKSLPDWNLPKSLPDWNLPKSLPDWNLPKSLPDWNLPKSELEPEASPPQVKEVEVSEQVTCESRSLDPGGVVDNPVSTNPALEQESENGCRRQSRRNRPLTTRALEALEYEFLSVKKRPRGAKQESSNSRRVRGKKSMGAKSTHSADDSTSKLDTVQEQKMENRSNTSSVNEHSECIKPADTEANETENGVTSSIDQHCNGLPASTTDPHSCCPSKLQNSVLLGD